MKRLLHYEPARFVLVGAFNTGLGFGLYSGLWLLVGKAIGYLACLYLSYAGAIAVAYLLYAHFVFRGADRSFLQFLRFASVYVVSVVVNTIALPALIIGLGLQPIGAQAVAVVITTVCSYFGHKFFSFPSPKQPNRQ